MSLGELFEFGRAGRVSIEPFGRATGNHPIASTDGHQGWKSGSY
jgi:hypothetical protein